MEEGKYIYCIIGANGDESFGPVGIGGQGDEVHTINHQDLAAVVSNSSIKKYPISRENTIAHQLVMEEAMKKGHTVLPVRFSTIAEGKNGTAPEERTRREVLVKRHQEFNVLLEEMDDKVELGVKALWKDMDVIFMEIVKESRDIRALKDKVAERSSPQAHGLKVKMGEMVKTALEKKRGLEEKGVLDMLSKISIDFRKNKTFGDRMITNSAFLVEKRRVKEFDKEMGRLTAAYDKRTKFKYIGPVPPCNFVEIVITWEEG